MKLYSYDYGEQKLPAGPGWLLNEGGDPTPALNLGNFDEKQKDTSKFGKSSSLLYYTREERATLETLTRACEGNA